MAEETKVPQPPTHLFVGNMPDVDPSQMLASLRKLFKLYGPVYALEIAGQRRLVVGSHELADEVFNDDVYEKVVAAVLMEVRHVVGTGLFAARNDERDWQLAHKLLIPVFGPLKIQTMFPEMMDLASQMLMKWTRLPEDTLIDPVDSFTRLTLDTIALCSFDYRFNSFYQNEMHPFVSSALDALLESGKRAGRTTLETRMRIWSQQKYDEEIQYCWKLCDEIVAERRANPREVNDLLNVMLKSKHPETGEMMRDELIRYEMMTFLIAGHDTTSGLLCFAFLEMLKNPQTLQAAQEEVDRVVGDGPLTVKHGSELKYVEAVLRESSTRHLQVKEGEEPKDVFIGSKRYRVHPGDWIQVVYSEMQRDPKVWGDDADVFRPERMLNGGWEALPNNAWRPFGIGARACIGRAFAWQEAWMAIALILQRFQVELAEPDYEVKIRQTLTIKPVGYHLKVKLRPGKSLYTGIISHQDNKESHDTLASEAEAQVTSDPDARLAIFYGSNQGTCKTVAEEIQSKARSHGLSATVGSLDSATELLPTDRPVVLITPSYEGQPPDNGKKFVAWLEANEKQVKLEGVKYCILGVGNSDWAATFHRIPKLVDKTMAAMGAERMFDSVFGDVARDIFGAFDDFTDHLWKTLAKSTGKEISASTNELKVEMTLERPEVLGEKEIQLGTARQHEQLADTSVGPEKRLMEVQLPEHVEYQAGDYLVVLPTNHQADVKRVLDHFGVAVDALLKLSGTNKRFLPCERPEYAFTLVSAYLEIGTPISRRQLEALAAATKDEKQKAELERLSQGDVFEKEVLNKGASIIDILQTFPGCELTFGAYIDMLQPMKPRQYSIASSPLASPPGGASIVYDVIQGPSKYDSSRQFHGVASSYLSRVSLGGRVHCYVRSTNSNFRLPTDPKIPIILICAGTGLAPMRGFLQERAAIAKAQGMEFGKAILYFGCRDPDKDYICRPELEEWEKLGVVELRPAFSQVQTKSSYKHVPDRIWAEREEVIELFKAGAKIFLCGSASKLAKSTNEVLSKMVMESKGCSMEEAKDWLQAQKAERYVTDIFG